MANLKVTLVRSVIGRPQNQRDIVKGLGLGRVIALSLFLTMLLCVV